MKTKTLADIGRLTEDEARAYLEGIRWPNGPVCPHCGTINEATLLQGESTRPGLYKCKPCQKPFTVTMRTIFEDSHIPLAKWIMAFHLMCSSKKGISALQLQRNLGLGSYKSAWHMAHRIRHAMRSEPLASLLQLKGIVEVDDCYVHADKPGTGQKAMRSKRNVRRKSGRGTDKTGVLVLVERDGEARAMARRKVSGKNLRRAIQANVEAGARVMTDSAADFKGLGNVFASHETTNHLKGEYARGDVHSNTAESYFAILKRSIHGIHHHVSERHLARYLDERSFVWNGRKMTDQERTTAALRATEGKRLLYEQAKEGAG